MMRKLALHGLLIALVLVSGISTAKAQSGTVPTGVAAASKRTVTASITAHVAPLLVASTSAQAGAAARPTIPKLVKDINRGADSSYPQVLTNVNGRLF